MVGDAQQRRSNFGSGLLLNVLLLLRRTQKLRWAAVLVQLGALVVLTVLSLTAVPNERRWRVASRSLRLLRGDRHRRCSNGARLT
jgi:hypothetical protein